ncbi:MAG: polysaccharide deacetylase family protein [Solirubrobacterales bacterium]
MNPTDGVAKAGRRSPLRGRSRGSVFLCYHSVTEDGPPYLSIKPATLQAQLRILVERGYRSGGRRDLDLLAGGGGAGSRIAFLTFDDGFRDTVTAALPLLREHGFTGMAFLLAGHLESGAPLDWPEVAGEASRRPRLMRSVDWPMVEQLAEAGWDIGSHGISHARMTSLSDEELTQELLDSRRLLAQRLGGCDLLAYPFGAWDERVARLAAAAGYAYAFSLPFGEQLEATRLSIPRVMVDDRDASWRFRAKLTPLGRSALFSPVRPAVRRLLRHRPHSHAD